MIEHETTLHTCCLECGKRVPIGRLGYALASLLPFCSESCNQKHYWKNNKVACKLGPCKKCQTIHTTTKKI